MKILHDFTRADENSYMNYLVKSKFEKWTMPKNLKWNFQAWDFFLPENIENEFSFSQENEKQ